MRIFLALEWVLESVAEGTAPSSTLAAVPSPLLLPFFIHSPTAIGPPSLMLLKLLLSQLSLLLL